MLARMHLAGRDYDRHQPNLRGLPWWNETVPVVLPHMDAAQAALLQSELAYQNHVAASSAYAALPRGPVHADLFRDNVMFDGRTLTGFFDFYFAGVDTWLFDLAVCLNDWCMTCPRARTMPTRLPPCSPPTSPCARSRPPSASCCPPCCARALRFGYRACGTFTCRARRRCSNPTTHAFRARCCAGPHCQPLHARGASTPPATGLRWGNFDLIRHLGLPGCRGWDALRPDLARPGVGALAWLSRLSRQNPPPPIP